MNQPFRENEFRAPFAVRALVLTLIGSVAAFGCTTNPYRTAGEPVAMSPVGRSVTSVSSTPGSAGPAIPYTMISAAVDPAVDAQAVLEAGRGFQGRVLGPAAPGTRAPSLSMQYSTGQLVPPALLANPQMTINSSISSPPVPAIVSGAGEGIGGAGPAFVAGVTLPGVGTPGTPAGSNANFGVTGSSNTTATGLASVTSPATNIATGTNVMVSTGVASAPATAGNVLATPILGTSPGLNVDNTAIRPQAAMFGGPLILSNPVTSGTPSGIRVVNSGGRVLVTNQGNQ